MSSQLPTALVTGASTGIGAVYADRLARRGHDLVLVARDRAKLDALAARLRAETGVAVEVLPTDLTDPAQLAAVEARLRSAPSIGLLVNNAGAAGAGTFAAADPEVFDRLIRLNVTSVARLSAAALPGMLERGGGAIINIASVVGLAPEIQLGVYGATKAFVLAMSQAMTAELGERGIHVQAVLPSATRTEIWERSGRDVTALSGVMEAGALVDAALLGFDRGETVTIPPLPDAAQWDAFDAARRAMLPNFVNAQPAARYAA
ncbi:SDR family NAD(P)-dependent oxidoreductase [Roseococcus sp. YIM B11640]|uniref:SDR family NAD(P)-dependent oxidoreductase n=1 Tax=Roseococcus sp. YIM B11640 TaxID=3133973 RepID=UPI003C7C2095